MSCGSCAAHEEAEAGSGRAPTVRLAIAAVWSAPVLALSMISALQFPAGSGSPSRSPSRWCWAAGCRSTGRPGPACAGGPRAWTRSSRWARSPRSGWSVVALVAGEGEVYFEVAAVVTTLVLAGRYLEDRATHRAGDALRALLALGAKDVAILERPAPSGVHRSRSFSTATASSCARGSASPPTGWWRRAPPPWTPRCSRASWCPWRWARATRSSARRSTRAVAWSCARRASAPRPPWPASAAWSPRPSPARRRCSGLADRVSAVFVPVVIAPRPGDLRRVDGAGRRGLRGLRGRRGGAHHRLPLRPGARDSHRPPGGHGARRPAGHPHPRPADPGVHPPGRHDPARQDRHDHHRPDGGRRDHRGRRGRGGGGAAAHGRPRGRLRAPHRARHRAGGPGPAREPPRGDGLRRPRRPRRRGGGGGARRGGRPARAPRRARRVAASGAGRGGRRRRATGPDRGGGRLGRQRPGRGGRGRQHQADQRSGRAGAPLPRSAPGAAHRGRRRRRRARSRARSPWTT